MELNHSTLIYTTLTYTDQIACSHQYFQILKHVQLMTKRCLLMEEPLQNHTHKLDTIVILLALLLRLNMFFLNAMVMQLVNQTATVLSHLKQSYTNLTHIQVNVWIHHFFQISKPVQSTTRKCLLTEELLQFHIQKPLITVTHSVSIVNIHHQMIQERFNNLCQIL